MKVNRPPSLCPPRPHVRDIHSQRILLYIFIWYDSELLVKDILIILGYLIDQIINNENNQLAEALLTNCICSNTLLNVSFVVSLSLSSTHKRYTFYIT